MALKQWLGGGSSVPQLDTITIGSTTTSQTFLYTVNSKTFGYTALVTDTTVLLVATGLYNVLKAVTEPEFTRLTFALGATAGTITVTGQSDGRPFTGTTSGTGTISTTTTTSPLSPSDYARAANWSGGVAPTTSDDIVFDTGGVDAKYNMAGLTAVALNSWTRRVSYTGAIGLPEVNPAGYREYLPRLAEVNAPSIRVDQSGSDQVDQIRIKATLAGSAVTLTVVGDGTGAGISPGSGWPCEITGLPGGQTNVVDVIGASLAICPYTGQTGTVVTLRAAGASVLLGPGVTLTNPTVIGGSASIACSFTTLVLNSGAAVAVTSAAAAATGCTIYGGALSWQSSGGLGAVLLDSNGALDLSLCPGPVTVGTISRYAGSTLNDPLARLMRSYTESYVNCGQEDCPTVRGTGFTAVIS